MNKINKFIKKFDIFIFIFNFIILFKVWGGGIKKKKKKKKKKKVNLYLRILERLNKRKIVIYYEHY